MLLRLCSSSPVLSHTPSSSPCSIRQVRKHPSPEISSSLFAALVNSAIIGGGVPLLIDLFKLDSASGDWGIRSPTWAKDPLCGTNDILSATFLGFVYLALMSPAPAQFPLIGGVIQSLGVDTLSNADIRTFCSLLLGAVLLAEKAVKLLQEDKPAKITPATHSSTHKNGTANGSGKNRKSTSRKLQ